VNKIEYEKQHMLTSIANTRRNKHKKIKYQKSLYIDKCQKCL